MDAYAVWVSEIMLQQTRVETVIPYFEKWIRLFPTVQVLAEADEQSVLNAWEGLGYYSRARNFHKAAKIVLEKYNGELPRELDELQKLPGVGRYTAGALASIVFGLDEPALDGNLKRVYARLFDLDKPINSVEGEKFLWALAKTHLPKGRAADFNQALMDLGATVCIPKKPRCSICPLTKECKALKNDTQEIRPVKKPNKNIPHRIHAAGVIIKRGRVLLAQRPSKGLLGGMWEFPNGRVTGNPVGKLVKALMAGYNLKVKKKDTLGVIQHTYTHFKVTTHVYRCDLIFIPRTKNMKWISLNDLENYPMGKIDRQIADMVKQ